MSKLIKLYSRAVSVSRFFVRIFRFSHGGKKRGEVIKYAKRKHRKRNDSTFQPFEISLTKLWRISMVVFRHYKPLTEEAFLLFFWIL